MQANIRTCFIFIRKTLLTTLFIITLVFTLSYCFISKCNNCQHIMSYFVDPTNLINSFLISLINAHKNVIVRYAILKNLF